MAGRVTGLSAATPVPEDQAGAPLTYTSAGPTRITSLWWEFVPERPAPWDLADCRVLRGVRPALRAGRIREHPLASAALRQAGENAWPADMLVLAGRLPGLLDGLDRMPQTYGHGDASPQNLLLPASEPGPVVVIDWGFGSLLSIGFDLGQLLVGLAHAGKSDPSSLRDIDAAIFPAYLEGLAAEDYPTVPGQVRAGYIGSFAARSALSALPLELLSRPPAAEAEAEFLSRPRLTRPWSTSQPRLRPPTSNSPPAPAPASRSGLVRTGEIAELLISTL